MSSTGFSQTDHGLVCDGVSLSAIAERVGTPVYVYTAAEIRSRFRDIDEAFHGYPHALHYALKANSTFAIAALLKTLGSAADANSVWEIDLARRAGFEPKDIVFTGVGKSTSELECAVPLGRVRRAARVESDQRRVGRRIVPD
jgi:diaminopimelate decarboxylase